MICTRMHSGGGGDRARHISLISLTLCIHVNVNISSKISFGASKFPENHTCFLSET